MNWPQLRTLPLVALGLAMAVAVGACGSGPAASPVEPPTRGSTADTAPASADSPQAGEAEAASTAPPDAPVTTDALPEQPAAAQPTATVDISPDLRATDPSTVQLASGEPLLVEFFAFW